MILWGVRTINCTSMREDCLPLLLHATDPSTIITMYQIVIIIVLSLATHRITRLITRDAFPLIAIPREKFSNRWSVYDEPEEARGTPVHPKGTNLFMRSLSYLWECDWCTSVWVGGILTLVTSQIANVPLPWLVWPAVSSIAGLIAQREPD